MCHQSPAKLMRNVKRMAKYNERKAQILTIKCVSNIDILPSKEFRPSLSVVFVQQTEIPPKPKPVLSFATATVLDIPPEDPRSHLVTTPCLPTNLPQPRRSLAPPPHWSSTQNCLPSHLRPRPSLVSPFSSRPHPTGPQTTSKPAKNLLQSLW